MKSNIPLDTNKTGIELMSHVGSRDRMSLADHHHLPLADPSKGRSMQQSKVNIVLRN